MSKKSNLIENAQDSEFFFFKRRVLAYRVKEKFGGSRKEAERNEGVDLLFASLFLGLDEDD